MKEGLDKKIPEVFPEECVYKVEENYSVFTGKNLPSFIKDWLVKKFTDEEETLDKQALLEYMEDFIPQRGSEKRLKGDLISSRNSRTVLARALIEPDVKKGILDFPCPNLVLVSEKGE